METFGDRLRKARESRGLNQTEVYKRTKINNKTLSRYEKNGSEPDYETLKILASLYEVKVEYLIGEDLKGISKEEMELAKENKELSDLIINIKDPIKKEQAISFLRFLANPPTDGAKK